MIRQTILRRPVNVYGAVTLPADLRKEYEIEKGKDVVFCLVEVLKHGELSRVKDVKVEVG